MDKCIWEQATENSRCLCKTNCGKLSIISFEKGHEFQHEGEKCEDCGRIIEYKRIGVKCDD